MREVEPLHIQLVGDELAVVWDDGHESYISARELREKCPCAYCAGEADLFGRIARPAARVLTSRSHEIASVDRVGNYGVQLVFGDGHSYGIWTHEKLRALCSCEECRQPASSSGK